MPRPSRGLETTLDEERWPEAREVVADALELAPGERLDFARQACLGDASLFDQVRTYLAHADTAATFMSQPIFSLHQSIEGSGVESWVGQRAGPFLLKELLGTGGMGAVYLGEHIAGDYDQDVAVKVLHPSRDSSQFIHRLQHERRILNSLIHPYIARFLEGGRTETGLPYIAMQRVDGMPIDAYCDRQSLSVPARIRLFIKVCSAVQFAHQKLVIHCDLKPANILITPEGQPQLLDFGIASLVDDDPAQPVDPSPHGPQTPHSLQLTPRYASPEQFRGEGPTTAVDVYALGLLLYELLTGKRAHRPDGDDFEAIRVAVCEGTPPPPSRAVLETGELQPDAQQRSRLLTGDLDSIVMRALEKQPDRRYPSAAALADDLLRYLDRQPVLARPQTFRYLTGKFIRRHAWGVVAAALLIGLALWMVVQALEIARQNEQLELKNVEITQERDRATEVREFLVDFLRVPDPSRSRGSVLTVKEALDAAAQRLESELKDEPEIRAELLDTIGRVFTNLALYTEAEPLLNDALTIRRETLGEDDALVAASLHNLAFLKRRLGDAGQAEALRRQAIAIQRRVFPDGDSRLARGLNALASLLRERRALEEAEPLAWEALSMQVRLLGDRHLDVARTLNTLASVSRFRSDLTRAASLYRQSLKIRREHVGSVDPGVAAVLNNLALVLVESNSLPEAIDTHRESLAIRRQIYPDDHPNRIKSLNNLALALSLHGEHAEALVTIQQAIAMHDRLGSSQESGKVLRLNRASVLERQGDPQACREAIEPVLAELNAGGRAAQVADAQSIHAGCLARARFFDEAEPLLLESYRVLEELLGSHARQTRQARDRIAYLYEASGRPELANRYRFQEPQR